MPTPRLTSERCLILSDGGLESAVVAAIAAEQTARADTEPPVVMAAWWGSLTDLDLVLPSIDRAVARQADMFGLAMLTDQTGYPPEQSEDALALSEGAQHSQMLLQAAGYANAIGIRRIVWPVRIGSALRDFEQARDLEQLANTIDRSVLAGRLATLDAGGGQADTELREVLIETPVVDFSNIQLADLAGDLSVPLDGCWWFQDRQILPSAHAEYKYWAALPVLNARSSAGAVEIKSARVDDLIGR
ncbi:MAG: hypothetical protein KC996_06875 [Phycisphaerales bacterium]|nr:hypothetical protein [Phycisphaerales bacterium]